MTYASFRFYGSLNDFLLPERQQVAFRHAVKDRGSVKDAIESLGVPHPEVDLILVNGVSAGFDYLVQVGDRISVYPQFTTLDVSQFSNVQPPPLQDHRFVLDVHLGKLATYLRLLGFDAYYHNDADDDELAQLASQEQRILLTQDRGLLKRCIVTYGYIVRSAHPEAQTLEVLSRFQLKSAIAPWQRCPRCNGVLAIVPKVQIQDQLPYYTRLSYDEFAQCRDCGQIYWQGAHYQRIATLIERLSS